LNKNLIQPSDTHNYKQIPVHQNRIKECIQRSPYSVYDNPFIANQTTTAKINPKIVDLGCFADSFNQNINSSGVHYKPASIAS